MDWGRGQDQSQGRSDQGGRAVRGVLAILGGTAIGQLVTLFALPVLARIYDPEEYGLLAVGMSTAAIISPMATLRMEGAVVLADAREEVSALVQAALTSLALTCLVLCLLIGGSGLQQWVVIDGRETLIWAVPLLVIATGCLTLFSQLAVREKDYSRIGTRNTAQSLSITLAQFALSPIRGAAGYNGLLAGSVFGTGVGVFVLREYAARYAHQTSWSNCWRSVKKYWKFPAVFGPMASFTLLAQQGPVFVIAHRFSSSEVGQFAMADRILAVPVALIGLAVGSVFEGEMSQHIRRGSPEVSVIYLKTSGVLGGVGVLGGLILWFVGRPALTWGLGDKWSVAGEVLAVMAIVLVSRMVVNPTRRFLQLLEKAQQAFALEVLRVVLFVGSVVFAAQAEAGLLVTLWWMLSALVVADVVTWVYGLVAVRRHDLVFA